MGHTNADCGLQDVIRARFDHLTQRLCDRSGLIARHTFHNHQKFFSTPSGHRILHPHPGLQDFSNSLQYPVSRVMAVLVIDCLEMVYIDHHYRVAALPGGKQTERSLCDPPVGNTGQGAGVRCFAQSLHTFRRLTKFTVLTYPNAEKP